MKMHILLVEDDAQSAMTAQRCLSAAGYVVHVCSEGEAALEYVDALGPMHRRNVWLALMSMNLPDMDGECACRRLRRVCDWPIVLIAERRARLDGVMTRRLGADDCMAKPYSDLELLGRVRAQFNAYLRARGLPALPEPGALSVRGLVLKRAGRKCSVDGRSVALTHTEFALLWELCLTPGKPVSAAELYRRIWREECLDSAANTVMVHVRHLRVKLRDNSNAEPYIRTVWREGYKVEP